MDMSLDTEAIKFIREENADLKSHFSTVIGLVKEGLETKIESNNNLVRASLKEVNDSLQETIEEDKKRNGRIQKNEGKIRELISTYETIAMNCAIIQDKKKIYQKLNVVEMKHDYLSFAFLKKNWIWILVIFMLVSILGHWIYDGVPVLVVSIIERMKGFLDVLRALK